MTCEVCGTPIRGDGPLCPQCALVQRVPVFCRCGHESGEHFTDRCNHSEWKAAIKERMRCRCTGFQAKGDAA